MNQNQLLKALHRSSKIYNNIDGYTKYLNSSALIKVGLNHINNSDDMARKFENHIKKDPIYLPFENLFFSVENYKMPNLITGVPEEDNIGLHIIPKTVVLGDHKIIVMVVMDYRLFTGTEEQVMMRSYIVYSDMSGMHLMPNVDKINAKTCTCYTRNVFSQNPQIYDALMLSTPCFSLDIGFAMPDCPGTEPMCEYVVCNKHSIKNLILQLFAYMKLSTNKILSVENISKKSRKMGQNYHVIVDNSQINRLKNGDLSAELYGNSFVDGSSVNDYIDGSKEATNSIEPFEIKGRKYKEII